MSVSSGLTFILHVFSFPDSGGSLDLAHVNCMNFACSSGLKARRADQKWRTTGLDWLNLLGA